MKFLLDYIFSSEENVCIFGFKIMIISEDLSNFSTTSVTIYCIPKVFISTVSAEEGFVFRVDLFGFH